MKLPLAADLDSRDSTAAKDALLTNCSLEKAMGKIKVRKRPGLTANTTRLGPAGGMHYFDGTLYSVFNDTLINETSAATYELSTQAYQGQQYQFSETAGKSGISIADGTAWTELTGTAGFSARTGHASCVFDGKIWMCGGTPSGGGGLNDVWYSSDGTTWTQATASANWSARYYHVMLAFANKMWVIGGTTTGTNALNDVWSSTDGITWTQVSSSAFSAGKNTARGVVFNNKMWVFGGYNGTANTNDVYSSSSGSSWTQETAAAAWAVRNAHAAAVFNNKMWISGGLNGGTVYDDVYSSSDGITWTQAVTGAAFGQIYQHQMTSYYGKLWIYAGIVSGAARDDIYTSTDGATWTLGSAAPGYSNRSTASSVVFNSLVYLIAGTTGSVQDDVWVSTANTTNTSVGPTARLMVKNKNEAWYLEGTTLTKISDADYPSYTVPGCVNLDGTFYVMDRAGQVYGSDIADPSVWTASNYLPTEAEPDTGVYLAKVTDYLVAMGEWSCEFLQNYGNASGSQLSAVKDKYLQIGCAAAGSVVNIENGIIFMSQSRQRGRQVMIMGGSTPTPVSTPAVERILNGDDLDTVYATAIRSAGHYYYLLTLVTSDLTLIYDIPNKNWGIWTSRTAQSTKSVSSLTSDGIGTATATVTSHGYSDGDPITIAGANQSNYNVTANITKVDANTFTYAISGAPASPATGTITSQGHDESYFKFINYIQSGNLDLLQHVTDGKIYEISPSYLNDNSNYIDTRIRPMKLVLETDNYVTFKRVAVIGDTVSANLYLRYSDDDEATWSNFRKIDMSTVKKELYRLGVGRQRNFELRHTDSTALSVSELDIDAS